MTTLGLDLAWRTSGWCAYNSQPIAWGTIETSPKFSLHQQAARLYEGLTVLKAQYPAAVWFVESTDWHQNLARGDWQQLFARERKAQAMLARAWGVFLIAAFQQSIVYHPIGVVEWRKEFGANTKAGVASYLAVQFPQLLREVVQQRGETERYVVVWADNGKIVPDHITDAMGISLVGWNRSKLQ